MCTAFCTAVAKVICCWVNALIHPHPNAPQDTTFETGTKLNC